MKIVTLCFCLRLLTQTALIAAPETVLTVWIDRSGSPDHLQKIAPPLVEAIRTTTPPLTGVEACLFGLGETSSWAEPCKAFTWGEKPVLDTVTPAQTKMPIAAIFRESHENILTQAKQQDDAEKRRRLAEYDAAVGRQLDAFTSYLAERPTKVPPCTRFEDLHARLVGQQRGLNLIITDGLMDCPNAQNTGPAATPIGRTIILLVPARKDATASGSEERRFAARSNAMARLFPWATFLPVFAIEQLPDILTGKTQHIETAAGSPHRIVEPAKHTTTPAEATRTTAIGTSHTAPQSSGNESAETVQRALRNLLTELHARHVRPSFGSYEGECYTDQMLQQMISTKEHRAIAQEQKNTPALREIISGLHTLSAEQQRLVLRPVRSFASHKTWADLGGDPTPDGQTVAGVRAEILISQALTELLEQLLK